MEVTKEGREQERKEDRRSGGRKRKTREGLPAPRKPIPGKLPAKD